MARTKRGRDEDGAGEGPGFYDAGAARETAKEDGSETARLRALLRERLARAPGDLEALTLAVQRVLRAEDADRKRPSGPRELAERIGRVLEEMGLLVPGEE